MFLYHLSMYNRNTIFNIYNHSKSSLKKYGTYLNKIKTYRLPYSICNNVYMSMYI